MSTVYLNGKFIPIEKAMVSVLDRGFLFGDGIYEVIPVYNRSMFRFKEHIQRLTNGLNALRIQSYLNIDDVQSILTTLIDNHHNDNQLIYIQITRGVMSSRAHAIPHDCKPTVFAQTNDLPEVTYDSLRLGIAAVTTEDTRWKNCHIKATSLLANVLLYQYAMENNAEETILIDDGFVTEASISNVFIVKEGVVITAPHSRKILGGITRDLIVELAQKNNIQIQERFISEKELQQADEVFISSSSKEIRPILYLNGIAVNEAKPGPVWDKLIHLFQDYKKAFSCRSKKSLVFSEQA